MTRNEPEVTKLKSRHSDDLGPDLCFTKLEFYNKAKKGRFQLQNKQLATSLLVTERLVNALDNFRSDEISYLFPAKSDIAIWTRIFIQWFIVRFSPTRPSPQVVIRTWRKHREVHLSFVHKFLHNAVHIILHTSPFFVKSNRFSTGLLQL